MYLWKNTRSVEESRHLARASWAGRQRRPAPWPRVCSCHIPGDHGITSLYWALCVLQVGHNVQSQHRDCFGWQWMCGIQEWQHSQWCFSRIQHCGQRGWILSELPSRASRLATSSSPKPTAVIVPALLKTGKIPFPLRKKKILFPSLFFLKGLVHKYKIPL